MFSKNILPKINALCLGLVVAFICIEIFLRIIGYFDHKKMTYSDSKRLSSNDTRTVIMAVGNSYTKGSGAKEGEGYPEQLEQLLNEKYPNKFQVINRGLSNINSSFIAENLESWILADRPKIVFFMVGEPNLWNKYGFDKFLNNSEGEKADTFLRKLKTYKLIELLRNRPESLLISNWQKESAHFRGITYSDSDAYKLGYLWISALVDETLYNISNLPEKYLDEAEESLLFIAHKDKHLAAALFAAEIQARKQQPWKYKTTLNYALNLFEGPSFSFFIGFEKMKRHLAPDKMHDLENISQAFQLKSKGVDYSSFHSVIIDDPQVQRTSKEKEEKLIALNQIYPESLSVIKRLIELPNSTLIKKHFSILLKGVKANPNAFIPHINKFLKTPLETVLNDKDPDVRVFKDLILSLKNRVSVDQETLDYFDDNSLMNKWVMNDLTQIKTTLEKHNIVPVVQSYPTMKFGFVRNVDSVIRNWARNTKNKDVVFLDVDLLLREKLDVTKGGRKFYATEYGEYDNHLNGIGYLEISRLMYDLIHQDKRLNIFLPQ